MNFAKVALITGASRGVGAAVARTLAAEGNTRIVVNYRTDVAVAQRLVEELEYLRPKFDQHRADSQQPFFVAIQADMASRDDMARLVQETVQQMGRLDIVISNVGWTRMTNFMDLAEADDEESWDRCFEVNVKSHFRLFRACQTQLESNEGIFIATASVAGVKPSGSSLPYAVTKAALIHLVKSLALIAGPSIRVNTVAPGVLMTDWGKQFTTEKIREVQEKNVLKRLTTPEDVAEQIKSLAMSHSITGVNVVIDAGFSL